MNLVPSPIDIDPVGQRLSRLTQSVLDIQLIDPQRLLGDALLIDTAIQCLLMVQRRIQELEAAREAAE